MSDTHSLSHARALLVGRQVTEAITTLRRMIATDSTNGEAHALLGVALIASGAQAEGMSHLERSTQLPPLRASTLFNYGRACEMAGDADRARQVYQRALSLDSAYQNALLGLERLGPEPAAVSEQREHADSVAAPSPAPSVSAIVAYYSELPPDSVTEAVPGTRPGLPEAISRPEPAPEAGMDTLESDPIVASAPPVPAPTFTESTAEYRTAGDEPAAAQPGVDAPTMEAHLWGGIRQSDAPQERDKPVEPPPSQEPNPESQFGEPGDPGELKPGSLAAPTDSTSPDSTIVAEVVGPPRDEESPSIPAGPTSSVDDAPRRALELAVRQDRVEVGPQYVRASVSPESRAVLFLPPGAEAESELDDWFIQVPGGVRRRPLSQAPRIIRVARGLYAAAIPLLIGTAAYVFRDHAHESLAIDLSLLFAVALCVWLYGAVARGRQLAWYLQLAISVGGVFSLVFVLVQPFVIAFAAIGAYILDYWLRRETRAWFGAV